MKKLFLVLALGGVLWVLPCGSAEAIPLFFKTFETKYAGADAKPEFVTLVKETKCNICHVKGEKKTVRNEYGEALHKVGGLEKDDFKKERVEAEPEAAEKEVNAALDKVAAEKSKGGETFGDIIKAGKIPE
jgi:hypothetical protein